MKYYSDVTKKLYDSIEKLNLAEEEASEREMIKRKNAEDKEKRKAVCSAALENARKARKDYEIVADQFEKDYGHAWTVKSPRNCSGYAGSTASNLFSDQALDTLMDVLFGKKEK